MFGVKLYYKDNTTWQYKEKLPLHMVMCKAMPFYQTVFKEWLENPPLCLDSNLDMVSGIFLKNIRKHTSNILSFWWVGLSPLADNGYFTRNSHNFEATNKLHDFLKIGYCNLK